MNDKRFPRVRPLFGLDPYSAPQTLATNQGAAARPAYGPNVYVPGAVAVPGEPTLPGDAPTSIPVSLPGSEPAQWIAEAHRYAKLTNVVQTIGTTSVLVISEPDTKRNFLAMRNAGSTNLYVNFGNAASTQSWLRLASNTIILFDAVVPQDDLYCISDASGGVLSLAYSSVAVP